MSELHWEAWAAILAFIITLGYTLYPGPYLTGAFTFIAQPLFALATAIPAACFKVLYDSISSSFQQSFARL